MCRTRPTASAFPPGRPMINRSVTFEDSAASTSEEARSSAPSSVCRNRLATTSNGKPFQPQSQNHREFASSGYFGYSAFDDDIASKAMLSPSPRRRTVDGRFCSGLDTSSSDTCSRQQRLAPRELLFPSDDNDNDSIDEAVRRRQTMPGNIGLSFTPVHSPGSVSQEEIYSTPVLKHRTVSRLSLSSRRGLSSPGSPSSLDPTTPSSCKLQYNPSPRTVLYGIPTPCTASSSNPATPRTPLSGSSSDAPSPGTAVHTRSRRARRAMTWEERGLDTPRWVARSRPLGRLLLTLLFTNMFWQELGEWYGLLSSLTLVLSMPALVWLARGRYTGLTAGYLAARLLFQKVELWGEMLAVFSGQTSNLLPAKQLAVVGTVLLYIGHTYYIPNWVAWWRGGAKAKDTATGLMYMQQLRPGRSLIICSGKLLLAPLFASIIVLQYHGATKGLGGIGGWTQRLLNPSAWFSPEDPSLNNWLLVQAAVYPLLLTGISQKRVPALLAALLVAEAFTCWRFWASVFLSKHYVWHLQRHFVTNLAVAGGLLLSMPEGKHDSKVGQEELMESLGGCKKGV